ncbi:nucleotide-binding domain containing protein, partial [Xanthomonas perforans]|uniref:nucleotide-binding domain containing protein n=1 Tax=Xanthomonas perforans TaxID=442694 RepID=UPI0019CF8D7B
YRAQGWLDTITEPGRLQPSSGSSLVLSGSCSRATLAQVANFLERHPEGGFALDPLSLDEGDKQWEQALAFAFERLEQHAPALIYASTDLDKVNAAQQALGIERAGKLVEDALSQLAVTLVNEGVGRLLV